MSAIRFVTRLINQGKDVTLAIIIVISLLFLLFPIPTTLLDLMLAFSISSAMVILMATILVNNPLDLNIFPTLLLITTLIRLALNVASTRLILSNGHLGLGAAGRVIESFGRFVMQDNIIVGITIFLVLTIINFVVITKGSGRIAEVAARFNLDAMPGKQMAIDSELTAGIINEEIAKQRRQKIQQESEFYGAMDGANKFVRGDALVGLIIIVINLIGGSFNGLFMQNIQISQLIKTYTILTVGDGLINQIPSLLISLSAGLLVTKAGTLESTNNEIFSQLSKNPKALLLSSILSACFAILPGLPFLPFAVISAAFAIIFYMLTYLSKKSSTASPIYTNANQEINKSEQKSTLEEKLELLKIRPITLEIGINIAILDSKQGEKNLVKELIQLRNYIGQTLGFLIPKIHIKENLLLNSKSYKIFIKDIEVAKGEIEENMLLVIGTEGEPINMKGAEIREPIYNLPAKWISTQLKNEAIKKGYTIFEPISLIITHMSKIIQESIVELLSYTRVQKLLDELSVEHQKLVKEVIPEIINVTTLQQVLHTLLKEGISIKDLSTILEAILEARLERPSASELTEIVRIKLSRQISNILAKDKTINAITLSEKWNQILFAAFDKNKNFQAFAIPPTQIEELIKNLSSILRQYKSTFNPVIVTIPELRPHLKSIINQFDSNIFVISHKEIHPTFRVNHLGSI